MSAAFIEFRCPNEPAEDKHMQCRRGLFGVSPETIEAHNFSQAPFIDYRFCPACGILYRVTIPALGETPVVKALPAGVRLSSVQAEDYFGTVRTEGSIPRRKAGPA
jgi:hypothetical protein